MSVPIRLLCGLAFLGLAACAASPQWINPERSAARQGADLTACRRQADRDIGPGAASEPGGDRSGNPMKLVEGVENGRRYEALVADCMEGLGYRRAP